MFTIVASSTTISWASATTARISQRLGSAVVPEHAYALVRVHGEAGWTARLVPFTANGLIYASSMVMLDSARRKVAVPALARWLLGAGIAATLAATLRATSRRVTDRSLPVSSISAAAAAMISTRSLPPSPRR
jgi:hypothetical protein